MMNSIVLHTVFLTHVIAAADSLPKRHQPAGREHPVDSICGPRCVQFVLTHYRIDEDLMTLVRELQGRDVSGGASLQQLAVALESRGIHTRAVLVENLGRFDWSHPAICALETSEAGFQHHFVVLTQKDKEKALWDGMKGLQPFNPPVQVAPVLLTSSVPICSSDLNLVWQRVMFVALSIPLLFVLLYRLWQQLFHCCHNERQEHSELS